MKNKTNNNKLKFYKLIKKIVAINGWSENIIEIAKKNKDFKNINVMLLFPDGYREIIDFSLDQLNYEVENKVNKLNIINLPTGKRIKKILLIRFEILNNDLEFYKKTFNHLLIPNNFKLLNKNLYKTVDKIWYLAGDQSTDFNFYTKRLTLALIYINALMVFYNKGFDKVENNLDKSLLKISKIPKIKNKLDFLKKNAPIFIKGLMN